jgi:uncharacterized iron-regulated membrane protein
MCLTDPRSRARWLFLAIHRWIGLGLGVWLAVMGVSGAALIFYEDFDALLHPVLRRASAPSHVAPTLDELLYIAKEARADIGAPTSLYMPIGDRTARFLFADPTASDDPDRAIEVVLSRDSGEVLLVRRTGDGFLALLYRLHSTLLAGIRGRWLIAGTGLALLAATITGLVLWWPRLATLRRSLTVDWGRGGKRATYDLHRTLGCYGSAALLLIATTGIYLAVAAIYAGAVSKAADLEPPAVESQAKPATSQDARNLQRALSSALARFPGSRFVYLSFPVDSSSPYGFNLRQSAEPSMLWPRTVVWVDQQSSTILAVRDAHRVQGFALLNDWAFPLHDGQAWGSVGRILYMFIGHLPLALLVTGWLQWRWRRQATVRRASG